MGRNEEGEGRVMLQFMKESNWNKIKTFCKNLKGPVNTKKTKQILKGFAKEGCIKHYGLGAGCVWGG